MKSASKKVYVNKAPRNLAMMNEEEKISPMDIDPPKPTMSSLAPGQGLNASLKGKKVKIVSKAAKEEQKVPNLVPAPKVPIKKGPVFRPQPVPVPMPNPMQLDSNIAEICMDELSKQNALATGDPIFCELCNAIFNSYSKLNDLNGHQVWECEFCEHPNIVHLEPEEIPTESKLVYVLETPEQAALEIQGKNDSRSIIFCIDMSGSMCVTEPISGNLGLKTNKLNELKKQLGPQEGPQYLPKEKKNVTYVSRLECVQAAIEFQLSELQRTCPNKRIGLVTFNNDVNIIGDGFSNVCITGDKLTDFEKVLDCVDRKFDDIVARPISQTKQQLCQRLLNLEESGPTALGPGLLASVGLAIQGGAGSKVILCTDGIANIGLGSLESESDIETSKTFYDRVGDIAKQSGIAISVISIASEECRLDSLSELVDSTGGELTKVNPQNLSSDFANILSQEILASNVTVTVNLHKALSFRNQEEIYLKKPTQLVKQLGSVTDQTIFTFEYTTKNTENLTKIPFQVTVDHRKMNGMRCVLVDTQLFEISEDQDEIMKEADFEVIARNVQIRTAQLVKQGQYSEARKNVDMWQGYMMNNVNNHAQMVEVQNLAEKVNPISSQLRVIEEEEFHAGPVFKKSKNDSLSVGIHKLSKKKSHN